jgi:Na+/melibiose symporter-like transporter
MNQTIIFGMVILFIVVMLLFWNREDKIEALIITVILFLGVMVVYFGAVNVGKSSIEENFTWEITSRQRLVPYAAFDFKGHIEFNEDGSVAFVGIIPNTTVPSK